MLKYMGVIEKIHIGPVSYSESIPPLPHHHHRVIHKSYCYKDIIYCPEVNVTKHQTKVWIFFALYYIPIYEDFT